MDSPSAFPIENRRDAVRLARALAAQSIPPVLIEPAAMALAEFVLAEEREAARVLGDLRRIDSAAPPEPEPYVEPPARHDAPTLREVSNPVSTPAPREEGE